MLFAAVALLASAAVVACLDPGALLPFAPAERLLVVKPLQLEGAEETACAVRSGRPWLSVRPGGRGSPVLSYDADLSVEDEPVPGVGRALYLHLRCIRYAVEVMLPLAAPTAGDPALAQRRADALLHLLVIAPGDPTSLWRLADLLRLNPSEPFVFGMKMELSESETVSLRLDPGGSGGRVMLVYRFEL